MTNLNRTLLLLGTVICFSSCGENGKSPLDHAQDTIPQQSKGLPLDNLNRSRAGDSTVDVNDSKSGLPLNNLERDHAADTVGHM